MFTVIHVERVYWKDVQTSLNAFIRDLNQDMNWPPQKREMLNKQIISYCKQGTGHQNILYKFISYQFDQKLENKITKIQFDIFTNEISVICKYLDENYLNKYPKRKKTLKSIKDIARWYWVGR